MAVEKHHKGEVTPETVRESSRTRTAPINTSQVVSDINTNIFVINQEINRMAGNDPAERTA